MSLHALYFLSIPSLQTVDYLQLHWDLDDRIIHPGSWHGVGQSLHAGTMRTRVFWQSIYYSDCSRIDEATSTDVSHSPHQVHMFTFCRFDLRHSLGVADLVKILTV
jgi:hypothetical protein